MIETLPKKIQEIVKNKEYKIDSVGRSRDLIINFENEYILKVSSDKSSLFREFEINNWLENKISSAHNQFFLEENDKFYYLRSCLDGVSLIDEKFLNNPELLIDVIVDVVNKLRNLDKFNCPINSFDNVGNNFVHGDLCLPNIFVDENNNFIGFIDLGNAGLGDVWYDYAWLLWSFEYNLGTDEHNQMLLDRLEIEYNKEKYNQYVPGFIQKMLKRNQE